jgi:uncharacterized protein (TIGR02996 family)
MTDGDALLAAILAEPKEDTPRLVYADYLDENGQPERAEFIRVQVELARLPPKLVTCSDMGYPYSVDCPECQEDDRREALRGRERTLLAGPRPDVYENEVVWFNAGDGTESWRTMFRPQWRRGFVEAVACEAADWLAHAAALLARHPIREVTLTTWPGRAHFPTQPFSYETWLMPPAWTGNDSGMLCLPEERRGMVLGVLANRWPRVAFTLPDAAWPARPVAWDDFGR